MAYAERTPPFAQSANEEHPRKLDAATAHETVAKYHMGKLKGLREEHVHAGRERRLLMPAKEYQGSLLRET
jgi:hypothetical protein